MFQNNLQYINNESLKSRLSRIKIEESSKDMSYCMTESNDYLLMKNDIPMDDIKNPRKAVQDTLKEFIKKPMEKNDIIITFGIGLCYQLDEVFNTFPSRIFVYEPDTELLHFVLNNVDISEHLKSGRVFLFDNIDDLIKKLLEIYITKDKVEIVYLKNYAIIKSQDLIELSQKVYEACKSKTVDVNTITRYSKFWLQNTLNNVTKINKSDVYKLSDLNDKFIGETALIAAAGPSLADNIQLIKENREKFVIFAVNKSLKTLIENGITPDFVVCIDARFVSQTIADVGYELPKINCIMNLNSDTEILDKPFKRKFLTFPENDIVIKRISEYNNFIETNEYGGSATTCAFVSAVKMGFSKIILSGVDLAFKGDVAYANGNTIEKVSADQIMLNNIVKNITTVPSVSGVDIITTEDYAAFIQHFSTLIKDLEYSEIYNTTTFGANIPGAKNERFENIRLLGLSNTTSIKLGEALPFKIDMEKLTQDELMLINNIVSLLAKREFSPALVASVVKTPLLYQYMQAEVLQALQSNMSDEVADNFIEKTKEGIKYIIDTLQKNKLI